MAEPAEPVQPLPEEEKEGVATSDLEKKLQTEFLSNIGEPHHKDDCIFCKIALGQEPKTKIIFQNEAVCVFNDIRPSTKEHLLIIPKSHHVNVKYLTKAEIPLLEYLRQVGAAVVEDRGGNIADSRVGFHWPPFSTVEHLHLHVIYPANEMGVVGRIVNKPNSFWFVTYEWAIDWLQKKKDPAAKEAKQDKSKEGTSAREESSGTHI